MPKDKPPKTKTFVLDTNVLLHTSGSIGVFADNDVAIPMAVIEELDKFKKNSDALGRNARAVIRTIDRLRCINHGKPGELLTGIPLKLFGGAATGNLLIAMSPPRDNSELCRRVDRVFGNDLDLKSADNRILHTACYLQDQGRRVVLISKDLNLRLKGDALGLQVMDFNDRGKPVDDEKKRLSYTGFREKSVPGSVIDAVYRDGGVPGAGYSLLVNEFVCLSDEAEPRRQAIVRCDAAGRLVLVGTGRQPVYGISPRNKEQAMALDLLLDPDIRLVTLSGGAGTGKTLLALAAALQTTLSGGHYEKILVSRPIIPMGNDIGFLPGSKDSKLSQWMQPIFDNLSLLLERENEKKAKSSSRVTAEGLISSKQIALEALTYIRGRSISRQYLIVDEAQNLTPHEIKTIISRAGEGTKIVLTGDPAQIDNPYLDAAGNGLIYVVERMKGQPFFGHVTLAKSERSPLAAAAASLL